MTDSSDLLTLFLLVLAAASALAFGLSLLTLALRGRRRRGEPYRDASAGPRHWSGDEYAERLHHVYFQKERHARAIRERDRQAREAGAHVRQEAEPSPAGDGQAAPTPEPPSEWRYRAVLELEGEVTPERVRLAYRRQIAAYHPDKVAGLGAKLQRLAEEETKAINEAYAFFRKRYGF